MAGAGPPGAERGEGGLGRCPGDGAAERGEGGFGRERGEVEDVEEEEELDPISQSLSTEGILQKSSLSFFVVGLLKPLPKFSLFLFLSLSLSLSLLSVASTSPKLLVLSILSNPPLLIVLVLLLLFLLHISLNIL